jgi:hypothetical protein
MRRSPRREQEQASVELGGRRLDYLLKRSSARRTLALRVSEQGEVVVNAPLILARAGIEAFLHRHADWVWQRLVQIAPVPLWHNGMALPYRGGTLALDWQGEASRPPLRAAERLQVGGPWAQVEGQVRAWYRREALAWFPARLAHHATRMGVAAPRLRLSDARSRWGSLSPKGVVSLNWRLVKAGPAILDYVICHELAHLRQRNHSAAFWREVAGLYPDFQAAREHLRREGRRYFEF